VLASVFCFSDSIGGWFGAVVSAKLQKHLDSEGDINFKTDVIAQRICLSKYLTGAFSVSRF